MEHRQREDSAATPAFSLLAVFIWLLWLPGEVHATDYFADAVNGSNSNNGLSLANAKQTISAAMALVNGNDRVLVAPGTYNERVKFPSGVNQIQLLAITAAGALDPSGADDHIIDGSGLGTGGFADALINIPVVDGSTSPFGMKIDGFTLQNNTVNNFVAAGITSNTDDIDISNVIIQDNTNQQAFGTGGIYVFKALNNFPSGGTFSKVIIRDNTAGAIGGIYLEGAGGSSSNYQTTIVNSLIVNNDVTGTGAFNTAGAVFLFYPASLRVVNSTFAHNKVLNAPNGQRVDGIYAAGFDSFEQAPISFNNSILWHPTGDDLFLGSFSSFSGTNNDLNDSGDLALVTSSFSSDPQFVDQPNNDFHLAGTSPCINAGNNGVFGTPTDDLDETSRPQGGTVDCGAYELATAPEIDVSPASHDFSQVALNSTVSQDITVTNTGTANLNIGIVGGSNPLAAPYGFNTDTCSSQSIAPAGDCQITVEFSPTSTGNFADSFDIPSNDADEASVVLNLDGEGVGGGSGDDTDGDGIPDDVDTDPNNASNACGGSDATLSGEFVGNGETLQCAASNSVLVDATNSFASGSRIEIYSLNVEFDILFSLPEGAELDVQNSNILIP